MEANIGQPALRATEQRNSVPDRVVLHVWHDGVDDESRLVRVDFSTVPKDKRPEHLEDTRISLRKRFGAMWGATPHVMTEEEILSGGPVAVDKPKLGSRQEEIQQNNAYRAMVRPEREADVRKSVAEAVANINQQLSDMGLPTYSQAIGALADAKSYVEASVRGDKSREFPNAYAYNMSRLAAVNQVLDKHRAVQEAPAPAPMPQSVSGFVLAFPGESQAVGDELIEMLRMGGNTVYRVDDETAGPVLREVAASAGLDADAFQP